MKVAICFPHYGDVKAGFAVSLARMVAFTLSASVSGPDGPVDIEPEIFHCRSSVLPQARNSVVAEAHGWGAEWLLLVDADHTFPPDTLLRLLAHGLPLVGCNYMKRAGGGPVVQPGEGLARTDHLGLGIVLVHRAVLDAMFAKAPGLLFRFEFVEDGGIIGEDVMFFRKAAEAGYRLVVDHELSRSIGHLTETELRL